MRLSSAYIPTQKENPSDAVIPSHQLMVRAGLIRMLAAGIYSYLPLGWKVMQKVKQIIREEMDRIGAQELQLPVLNPIEIWDETGRNEAFGDEMFRLKDRKNRCMAMAPTHEEIICDLARRYIKSYKDMPQIWYQIQSKFRDEPRPRSGVIRARQFFMKDSYSLNADQEGLDQAYNLHAEAYRRIFSRCGLDFFVVGASSGLMGGSSSQEFMLEFPYGEDTLVLCQSCDYASNIEVATSVPEKYNFGIADLEKVHTPGKRTIEEVSDFLKLPKSQFMKSLVYFACETPLLILLRGDHEVNEAKLTGLMQQSVRPAYPEEALELIGTEVGYIGPVGLEQKIRTILDSTLENQSNLVTGANEKDYHFTGIRIDRDIPDFQVADIRNVLPGENCSQCGASLRITHAMELGHIFKLGTKYASSMKATFLDRSGKAQPIVMGSYGIGVERIIAASIEQNHDEKGIIWSKTLAPFQVHLIGIKMNNPEIEKLVSEVYQTLMEREYPVLLDDRPVSPGFKFKDADLIGIPIQVVIGEKGLKENKLEIKFRKTGETVYCDRDALIDTILTCTDQIAE